MVRALVELRTGTGPLPAAARRSVRVTLAACAGFYGFLYGLHQPVTATYALFTAVALAGLSRIPGTGRQRAAVIARLLPAACALVAVGTFLAVRTWAAVAGMLVIGFCVAFGAVAGPRQAGAAPGLQLLYILPSFPPYAPDTLGERLTGTVTGVLLLILAETFLLPDPPVPRYRDRAAAAAAEAARCAAVLEEPPHSLPGAELTRASELAQALRPSRVPEAERPAGPGLRERALTHTGLAARTLLTCLQALPPPAPGRRAEPAGLDLVRAVRVSATATAALLAEGRPPDTGSATLRSLRASLARTSVPEPGSGLRHAKLVEVADAALVLRGAAEIAVRGRAATLEAEPEPEAGTGTGPGRASARGPGRASGSQPPDRFWYARQSTLRLWWFRLSGHTGPRSVHFQNAVRLGLALAAARAVAGLVSLPHGFWATLAVLSLTRTTAVQTRATVRLALIGTCAGALAAGGVLALAGEASVLYEIVLPPLMLVAFCVGPVRGVGWAQAMFTLVIAMAFAQLAPVTWQLAEVRFLDVLIGSVIGIACGLLAWPRGAHDELARAVAELLRAAADDVQAVTAAVGRTGPEGAHQRVRHALVMVEAAHAQYQTERQHPAGPGRDWQAAMMAGHEVLWGNLRLLGAQAGPPPGPREEAAVREYGARVAAGLRHTAGLAGPPYALGPAHPGSRTDPPHRAAPLGPAGQPQATAPQAPAPHRPEPAAAPLVYFAAMAWLDTLARDLALLGRTTAEPASDRSRA
ncbi:FUSC family protein [Streptomyces sp. ISL-43]|uniref:FUSC family protein n=1 Tax=Streptomyces sp. ISL-43 TaxID=2819183 RepID=UPI001BE78CEF|nr:FUSC family protein [Streptomyces sp. ISL-43]MBT2450197.1 FUSC family protein [Streptomyces sp. ISL-43]